jgi:predicted  nucleic acid-binding Zn-ribbon protein
MWAETAHAIGNFISSYREANQPATDMDGDDMGSGQQMQGEQQNTETHKSKRPGTNRAHGERRTDIKTRIGGDDKGRSGDGGATARELRVSNRRATNDLQRELDDARRELKESEKRIDEMEGKIDNQQRNITTLTQEKYRIDREAKENERKLADSEWERSRLQRDVNELRDGIARMKKQRDLFDQGAKEKERKLAGSERERIRLQSQIDGLQDDIARTKSHGQTLEQQLRRQDQDANMKQTELDQVQSQYSQTQALLEVRTQELKGAQSFLTKADSLSGAEVTSMVEGLNSEILQTAAFIADSFEFSKGGRQEQGAAYSRVTQVLGDDVSKILTSIQHSEDPMLVQIALQSWLVGCSKHLIETWYFERGLRSNQLLRSVYDRVRQSGEHNNMRDGRCISQFSSEDQAVSGRWRILTHSYARTMGKEGPEVVESFGKTIATHLVDILIMAGYQGSHQAAVEKVFGTFSDKINVIITASLRLNLAIGEEISSCDLEPMGVQAGDLFDPSKMDDIGGDHGFRKTEDRVLCTTEVGLRRVQKQTKENRSSIETKLLLKPKVALESIVEHMSKS